MAKKKKKKLDLRRRLRTMRKTGDQAQARDKDHSARYRDGTTDELASTFSRIVSRHDRRQRDIDQAREMLREQQFSDAGEVPENTLQGVIVQVVPGGCIVDTERERRRCVLRGLLKSLETQERNVIAVGDEVLYTLLDDGTGVIERILPRRTILSRKYMEREHVVAVNVDQLIIVVSVDAPPIRTGLIDRYIVAAENGDLESIICVNKIDLAEDDSHREMMKTYEDLGYSVVYCSAETGAGLDDFREILRDHVSIFAGQSGVGKSSILNSIQPDLELRIGDISESTQKGTHTTTTVELLTLEFGGYVIDTPGIREFALWDVPKQDLSYFFREFADFIGKCKMRDCSHTHEPVCSVKQAVEEGKITPERYESYVRLIESLD